MLSPLLEAVREICRPDPEAAYVGGCVRDWLLGRPVTDIDLATSLDPRDLGRALASRFGGPCFYLRERDETTRVILTGLAAAPVTVDLVRRRGSLREDLLARDFTINSLGLPAASAVPETVYVPQALEAAVSDPAGGRADLEMGVLRATRPDVFQRDPVRLLRALRLRGLLGFRLEEETRALMRRDAGLLAASSVERVRDEVFRLLEQSEPAECVEEAAELGVLAAVAAKVVPPDAPPPEIRAPGCCPVLRRVQAVIRSASEQLPRLRGHLEGQITAPRPRHALLRWSGLILDLWPSAPAAHEETTEKPSPRPAPFPGADWLKHLMRETRLSQAEGRAVVRMLLLRRKVPALCPPADAPPPSPLWRFRFLRDAGAEAPETVLLALAAGWESEPPPETRRSALSLLDDWLRDPAALVPPPLLTGDEIARELGLRRDARIAAMKRLLHEAQGAGEVRTREEALGYLRAQRLEGVSGRAGEAVKGGRGGGGTRGGEIRTGGAGVGDE